MQDTKDKELLDYVLKILQDEKVLQVVCNYKTMQHIDRLLEWVWTYTRPNKFICSQDFFSSPSDYQFYLRTGL